MRLPQRPFGCFLVGVTSWVWPHPGARLAVPTASGLWLSLALFSGRTCWSCFCLASVSSLLLPVLVVGSRLVPGACVRLASPGPACLGRLASVRGLSATCSRPGSLQWHPLVSELPPAPTLLSPQESEPAPHLLPHLLSRPRCHLVWDCPGSFFLPKAELILWR